MDTSALTITLMDPSPELYRYRYKFSATLTQPINDDDVQTILDNLLVAWKAQETGRVG